MFYSQTSGETLEWRCCLTEMIPDCQITWSKLLGECQVVCDHSIVKRRMVSSVAHNLDTKLWSWFKIHIHMLPNLMGGTKSDCVPSNKFSIVQWAEFPSLIDFSRFFVRVPRTLGSWAQLPLIYLLLTPCYLGLDSWIIEYPPLSYCLSAETLIIPFMICTGSSQASIILCLWSGIGFGRLRLQGVSSHLPRKNRTRLEKILRINHDWVRTKTQPTKHIFCNVVSSPTKD